MLRLPPDPTHGPPGKPLAYLLKVTRAPSRFWAGRPRPCGHTATQHVERMVLSTRELAPVGVRAHVPDRHRQTHSGHPRPALDPASGWNRAKLPQRTLETPTKRPHTQQVRCSLLGWAPRAPPRTAPRKKDQKPPGSQGSLVWYRRHRFSPWHPWPPTTIRCRPRTCDYPHPTVVTTTLVTQWPGQSARPPPSPPQREQRSWPCRPQPTEVWPPLVPDWGWGTGMPEGRRCGPPGPCPRAGPRTRRCRWAAGGPAHGLRWRRPADGPRAGGWGTRGPGEGSTWPWGLRSGWNVSSSIGCQGAGE